MINDILKECEKIGNLTIYDSFVKAYPKIDAKRKIVCAISGGSDSDVMLDILCKLDVEKKIIYVFFDTGIEYEATKKHLDNLEQKYGITIYRIKAKTPVPLGCRKYGLPFWSKYVSEMIERLQKCGFEWQDKPCLELLEKHCKEVSKENAYKNGKLKRGICEKYGKYWRGCAGAIFWWCNEFEEKIGKDGKVKQSKFNINHIRGLKEFMIENPPPCKFSSKCCKGAKKDVAKDFLRKNNADLNIVGIRKAEGGIRATAYKTCFDNGRENETWDNYRVIFWFTDKDKIEYEELFSVTHSACYMEYGLKRTGCAGCPFGKEFEEELKIIQKHEPKLYKAVNNIFGESYEYTRKFLEFRKSLFTVDSVTYKQQTIFDTEDLQE